MLLNGHENRFWRCIDRIPNAALGGCCYKGFDLHAKRELDRDHVTTRPHCRVRPSSACVWLVHVIGRSHAAAQVGIRAWGSVAATARHGLIHIRGFALVRMTGFRESRISGDHHLMRGNARWFRGAHGESQWRAWRIRYRRHPSREPSHYFRRPLYIILLILPLPGETDVGSSPQRCARTHLWVCAAHPSP